MLSNFDFYIIGEPGSTPYNNIYVSKELPSNVNHPPHSDTDSSCSVSPTFSNVSTESVHSSDSSTDPAHDEEENYMPKTVMKQITPEIICDTAIQVHGANDNGQRDNQIQDNSDYNSDNPAAVNIQNSPNNNSRTKDPEETTNNLNDNENNETIAVIHSDIDQNETNVSINNSDVEVSLNVCDNNVSEGASALIIEDGAMGDSTISIDDHPIPSDTGAGNDMI